MLKKRSALRLLGVFAMVVGMLVPAATASAGGDPLEEWCDGIFYDADNPAHHMMGQTGAGWTIMDGYMFIDLSGAPGPQVVFWNGEFAFGNEDGKGVYVIGSPFNDTICGTDSDDVIYGKKGNDRIFLNDGRNDYQDSTDWNPLNDDDCAEWCGDRAFGGAGHDLIYNGEVDDSEDDSGDGAFMSGGKGNDLLFAGDEDVMKGGQGNDRLYGYYPGNSDVEADGPYYMYGGQGDDILVGVDDLDQGFFYGRSGDDTIYPSSYDFSGDWDLGGGRLTPGGWKTASNAGWVFGGAGNDTIDGRYICDVNHDDYYRMLWYGGDGDDHFWFSPCNEDVAAFGGEGNDMFHDLGSYFDQFAFGGQGNDTFFPQDSSTDAGVQTSTDFFASGDAGNDTINGGEKDDVLLGGTGTDTIKGDAGDDWIHGDDGDDNLEAGDGRDRVEGGFGNDTILGGPGYDTLFGGFGTNWGNPVSTDGWDDPPTNWGSGGPAGGDCVGAVAAAAGTKFVGAEPCVDDGDDTVWGGTGPDDIDGGTGDNILYGNAPDPQFGLDVDDGLYDWMVAWSSYDVATGTPPAFTTTFFGHCPNDQAWVSGTGSLGYSVVPHPSSNLIFLVSPCLVVED